MAEEASRIGVSVDTVQAVNNIRNLAKEIRKTSKDVDLFDKFMNQLNPVLSSVASGFGSDTVLLREMCAAVKETASGMKQLNSTFDGYAQGATKAFVAGKKVIDSQREMTKTMNDMAKQANRFNTGNIAAQFQDIVVTSQMGMRPLSIGLQQGTQLVYILQQSKAPLADFVVGLKSLISPLSLITVGLTALLAAGIQFVDWIGTAQTVLHGLGNVFDFIGKHIVVLSSLLVVLIGNFIRLNIVSLEMKAMLLWTVIKRNALAFYELAKGITAAKIAMSGNWLKQNKALLMITVAVLGLAAAFEYLYKKITGESIIENLGNKFDELADKINSTGKDIENFTKKMDKELIKLNKANRSFSEPSLYERTYEDKMDEYMTYLPENELSKKNSQYLLWAKSMAKSWAENAVEKDKYNKKIEEEKEARRKAIAAGEEHKKTIEGLRNEYDELAISYQTKINDIAFEKSTRGMTEEQKLVAEINHEYDQEIAKLERKVALKEIDVGLFAKEKSELEKVKQGYIESTLEKERYNESVKNFNAVMDYSSSLTKGFFSDLKKGLKDGESAWESFTNAVVNMLDKIQDKIMDLAIDTMFNSLKQGNASSGSGLLGSIINAGVSWVTGGIGGGNSTAGAFNAMGGQMGVKPAMAADGGVFSNGIYSSPTVFKFAKGGKFGVMGEAGPEAVMPLRRGPDGSLGVKADGVGGSPVVVNVINNSNAQARTEQRQTAQGVEIDVLIDEMVAEKLARPGTSSNGALRAFNNRQLVMR